MKFVNFFLLFFLASQAFAQDKTPTVVASINPLYQIILAITQDKNNTILIINSAVSEHNYQLKKSDFDSFSKADLVFYIDDALEKNFVKAAKNFGLEAKAFKVSAINKIKLLSKKNNPEKKDLHLWLNPQNAIIFAEFVAKKLSEIDEKNAAKYQKNLEKFKVEVVKTQKEIEAKLATVKDSNYVFYHDGYQYFENYFALKPLKIISFNNERELSVKEVRAFDVLAKNSQVKCLFGEVYDEKNSALKLAQNYKIKFMALDLVGTKENANKEKSGYSILLLNLADDMVSCLQN